MKKTYILLTCALLLPCFPIAAQGLPPLADLEPIEHTELPPIAQEGGRVPAAEAEPGTAGDGAGVQVTAAADGEAGEAGQTEGAAADLLPAEAEGQAAENSVAASDGQQERQALLADGGQEAEEAPPPERKALEIEGADHPLTARYRELYMAPQYRKIITQALERSVPYRPYIREQLAAKGLPLLLQYLPIVESHYTVGAVSYAGATGIWQFMTNSMAPLLSRNTWYDDRRDPWKSTDAAILKLATNHTQFKDWAIAIAAYNCGSGAMARVLRQNPEKDFWYLAEHNLIKSQSVQYVPKLLAMADLIENAEYYGLTDIAEADGLIEDAAPEEFAYLTTSRMYSFNQVAELSGIEESTLRQLNPALLRNCTPARLEYRLRLPEGTELKELAQKLKEAGTPSDAIVYTVSKGDTLWGISRQYKLSVADLCMVNDIKENNILRINQKLIIPVFD